MKVLLIHPYFLFDRKHEDNVTAMPMGVYYLGAICKAEGHDVYCVNWSAPNIASKEIVDTLRNFHPDVVGFSIFHGNRWGALDIAACVRELLPKAVIVFGGVGATFLSNFLLHNFACIDVIVMGEGDISFPALLRALRYYDSLHTVPGIAFRHDGGIVQTEPPYPVQDLDDLPMPAAQYTFQHLALTRGCPGKCTFCGSPRFWGPKIRSHSPEYFVEQMRLLHARGVRFFYVSDDTFTLRKDAVLRVCDLVRSHGLHVQWAAISRVDCVDAEILTAMRQAGCIQVSYGVESGAPEIRKMMRKNVSNEQIEHAFRLTTEHGLLARAYIIYGSPGETDETIQASMQLSRRIKPCISLFHVMSVFPGTELYTRCLQKGHISEKYWLDRNEDLFWFECDPNMHGDQVVKWGKQLKNDYYQNLPKYIAAMQLENKPELRHEQADFLSRLGFTFEYGDYATLLPEDERTELARTLYRKALDLAPDPRAGTALGTQLLREGKEEEALQLLLAVDEVLPENEDVGVHLAGIYMRRGSVAELRKAKDILERVGKNSKSKEMHERCCKMLSKAVERESDTE